MKKILIVEDDFFIRDVYSRIFSISGFDVQVASDGAEALDKIKNSDLFDIVLLDVMMPKMSGIEVLQALRVLEPPIKDTPVFIITNLGQQNVIDDAFKVGMDGYIIKSQVTPKQLVDEITAFLNSKESGSVNGL
ncbi:MAG TPA: response regulator [Candidatus Saccharimonadales bacterium]|nr:response regulator [Candidatus Saccharimonadales bacterium]